MPVLESAVEKAAIDYSEGNYLTMKYGKGGWPDRIFVNTWGVHVWIEIKRPRESPKKLQIYRINQLRLQGVPAYWSDDLEEIKEILDHYAEMDAATASRESYPALDIPSLGRPAARSWVRKNQHGPGGVQAT